MGKDTEVFDFFGQLEHPLSSSDIDVQSVIEGGVEVDASCAVDDHVAALDEQVFVLLGQSQTLLQEIALSELI